MFEEEHYVCLWNRWRASRASRRSQGLRITEAVWHAIDTRGDIDQVLLAAAVSGANGKSYSFEEPGNRVSMGSSHSVADPIVVRSSAARTSLCRRTPPACSRDPSPL